MSEADNEISLEAAMTDAFNEVTTAEPEAGDAEIVENAEFTEPIEENLEESSDIAEDAEDGEEAAEATDDSDTQDSQDSDEQAVKAPASWNAEMKEKFSQLPPDVQDYFLKRESQRDAFVEQKSQEYNRIKQEYDSIESNFDSVRHVLQQTGLNTAQATQELVGLWKFAEQDPVGYVNYFLNSKGIDLQQLAQGNIDPVHYQQKQLTSKLSALESELNSLKQNKSVEQDQVLLSEIQNFSSKPENKYFDSVRDDMAFLLEAGRAKDLGEAYKMACFLNPDVSAAIEKEKAQERAKNANAKAQAAKQAAGARLKTKEVSSVTKASTAENMEDAVREAFEELTGGVAA